MANQFKSLIAASGQAAAVTPPAPSPVLSTPTISVMRPSTNRKPVGKRVSAEYKQIGVYIPIQLHKKAKAHLLSDFAERDFSDLVTDLLTDYLNNRISS